MANTPNAKELAARFGVSEQDINGYIQEFQAIDANKDGKISAEELHASLNKFGCTVSLDDTKKIVQVADTNKDDKIDLIEFLTLVTSEIKSSNFEKEAMLGFQRFDRNHDGFISPTELRATMAKLGEPLSDKEVDDMIKLYDTNKDGRIDYKEFLRAWKDMNAQKRK